MNNLYRNYYEKVFRKTGGFMPAKPLKQNVYPGDFFQIINGEMILLGNIYLNEVIGGVDCEIGDPIALSPERWAMNDGVSKLFSKASNTNSDVQGEGTQFKQVLGFEKPGSFMFKANEPETVGISNWDAIEASLLLKLTQTHYSFREVYVVTDSVTADQWTLAISGSENGELEVNSVDMGNIMFDLFGHNESHSIESRGLEVYQREKGRRPNFFKAKKLSVRKDRSERFVGDLIRQRGTIGEWVTNFYSYEFEQDEITHSNLTMSNSEVSAVDLLKAGVLNPNTADDYFRWEDASLEDVDKLFLNYGK